MSQVYPSRLGLISRSHSGRALARLLASAVVAGVPAIIHAATKSYIGPNNGNFSTAANWSPSGVPVSGDDVTLGNSNTSNLTGTQSENITVNSDTMPIGNGFNSLTLNSSGLPSYVILNEIAGGNTVALTENIGTTVSDNEFVQSGGSENFLMRGLSPAASLNLGVNSTSNNNTYSLSGTNTSLTVQGNANIGVSGSGLFLQSGGTATFDLGQQAQVTLGVNAGSSGVYTLSGGVFQADATNVGSAGSGVFNLTASGVLDSDLITISSTNGTAVFNMSGGSIGGSTQGGISVGSNGTFNLQSGASLNQQNVTLGSGGTFNMEGGAFSGFGGILFQGGTFQLLGNSTSLVTFSGLSGIVQNGALLAAVLTVNTPVNTSQSFNGTIQDGPKGTLGLNISGTLQLGGVNTYSGNTTVQASGLLQTTANGAFSPNSNVVLSGGTLDAATFTSSIASLSGNSGNVNIGTGGVLNVGLNNSSTTYGATLTGAGTFNKTGTGIFTMSGGGSFTGAINVQQGALAVGAINGIPTGASVTLGSIGAALQVDANQSLANFSSGVLTPTTFSNNAILTVGTGNLPESIGAVFSGAGTFVKVGSGTTTFGFGDSFANTDSSLIINVEAGTLALGKNPGTNAVAGPLNIGGGTVLLNNSNQIADTSTVTITSGSLNLAGFNETIGGLAGASAGNVSLGGGTLTAVQSTNSSYGGSVTGAGLFNNNGSGTLTLSGANTYTGAFVANAGLLVLQGNESASGFTANSGGVLQFNASTLNLAGGPILANPGGTVQYVGSNVSDGYLRGSGTHVILPGAASTFNAITTYNSTTVTQDGPTTFNNFANGGTLNNNASLTFNGGVNANSGIINVANVLNTQDFTNNGVVNVAPGATIANSSSNLYLGGGSRMYLGSSAAPGGALNLQGGTTLEINGALLVNDGTINGTTDVNYGGTAEGVGSYGPVNVTYGGLFQPGFTAMGTSIPMQGAIISSLTGSGTVDNQSAHGNIDLTVNSTNVSTFSGVIQNTTGSLGLNLTGSGGLTLLTTTLPGGIQSTNSYTGGTTINGGTFTIGAPGALPAGGTVVNNASFNVLADSTSGNISGTGSLTIGPSTKLTLASNTGMSSEDSLGLNSGSTLDLTNNVLAINYESNADPVATIRSELVSGYDNDAWNGVGIDSSTAAAHSAYAIGYADGSADTGTAAAPGQVLLKFTLVGDANLDGTVNLTDLLALLNNYGESSRDWADGDSNYDGTVNLTDLLSLLNNYGQSAPLASSSIALANFSVVSAVPEPGSLALLILGATSLVRRRRT